MSNVGNKVTTETSDNEICSLNVYENSRSEGGTSFGAANACQSSRFDSLHYYLYRLSRVINQSIEIQREFKNVSQTIRDMQVSVYNFWQRITPVESIIFLYSRKTQQSISQYILSQQDVQGIVKHISVEHAALVSFAVVPK